MVLFAKQQNMQLQLWVFANLLMCGEMYTHLVHSVSTQTSRIKIPILNVFNKLSQDSKSKTFQSRDLLTKLSSVTMALHLRVALEVLR